MKKLNIFGILAAALFMASCASEKVDIDSVASLKETKTILEQADKEGADKFAPTVFKQAQAELDKAAKVMKQNPDTTETDKWVQSARFSAKRALVVTRESKAYSQMEPEQIALKNEQLLAQMSQPLKLEETRDKSFREQASLIENAISESADMSAKNTELLGQKEKTDKQLSALQSKDKFNVNLEKASSVFKEEEADVYRKGNAVVIRLKTMQFPSGKATITPDKYSLLSKLKESIGTFKNPVITIEGHTDSVGAPAKNKELSLNRANSVKEYLAANTQLEEDKIKTVGYGSEKPIASNETDQGRVMNRRVDVIIQSSQAE